MNAQCMRKSYLQKVQTFSDSIEAITLLFAKWVNLWIDMYENSAKIYF